MIRFQCPKCKKKLSVQDALAGRLAICPACKERVRIPAAEEEPEEQDEAVVEKPRGRARPRDEEDEDEERPRRPVKRRDEEEEEDEEEERPRRRRRDEEDEEEDEDERPQRRRREEEDEEEEEERPRGRRRDEEEDEEEEAPRRRPKGRRKKKRRPQSSSFSAGDPYVMILGGIAILGLLGAIGSFFLPVLSLVPAGLGWLTMAAGGIWFLIVAFSDEAMQGILCLCVPFYSLYYLFTHFEECKKPFFVQCTGFLILFMGGCAGGIRAATQKAAIPAAEVRVYCRAEDTMTSARHLRHI